MRSKVIVLFDQEAVPPDTQHRLNELASVTWHPGGISDLSDANLEQYEILVTESREFKPGDFARLRNLRLIITTGTSHHYIDANHCVDRGITVCNTPDYTGAAVAEHAFGLLLERGKRLRERDKSTRSQDKTTALVSMELYGKTAGIIGLGGIGNRIAGFAQSFGMNVIYSGRTEKTVHNASFVPLSKLLAESDAVFLSAPLTSSTRHIINSSNIVSMRKHCIIVNVSAEELVDPDALCKSLTNGTIAGAALDIVCPSPRYFGVPNLTLTSGRGWHTAEAAARRATKWLDTLAAYLAGTPKHVVTEGRINTEL